MIICLYEDRPDCLVGLKLTILSLMRYCPAVRLTVTCPRAPAQFLDWLGRFSQVDIRGDEDLGAKGWDVKPALLLRRLSEGHEAVVWFDSDIIATGPIPRPLRHASADTCVVAEENYLSSSIRIDRAAAWGLPPGRRLPTISTGVVRVTSRHTELLEAWRALLTDPGYLQAQARPWDQRPRHLIGDQDALEALLGSRDFASVQVSVLSRGTDIAQCLTPSGYTPLERLRTLAALRALPPLVHSQGAKPWSSPSPSCHGKRMSPRSRFRDYYTRVHLEVSPYTAAAREYRHDIGEDAAWLDPRTRAAQAMVALSRHHPAMQEFPLAVLHSAGRRTVRLLRTVNRARRLPATDQATSGIATPPDSARRGA